jgi:hypothetical protein
MWIRTLQHIHGHLAILSCAALLHPAFFGISPRGRRLAVTASVMLTVTFVLGGIIYPDYTEQVRKSVYQSSYALGLLFERKEHIALGAVCTSWLGTLQALYSAKVANHQSLFAQVNKRVRILFTVSAALTVFVSVCGIIVTCVKPL